MAFSWIGTNLEVDLSQGKVEKVKGDPGLVERFLGGKGINAKILWDRVPPEVSPFAPENLLIIGAGLLTGTVVPGANRVTVTCKSPVTGIHSYSSMGGFFGAELKHAGYDTLVISGKSPAPVYLWIKDERVEIRDASHLWGKDTRETQRLIREELGVDGVQTMCIGAAGENKVLAASIEHSSGATASRGGAGAIMGDKKLKAIAVYGTKDISVANPVRLLELCEYINGRTEKVRTAGVDRFAYFLVPALVRTSPHYNWGKPLSTELQEKVAKIGDATQAFINKERVREVACYNCGLRCKHCYPRPEGGYSFTKCQAFSAPLTAGEILDPDFAVAFNHLCEKYGMDYVSAASYVAFAIDLYENGILTKEDTGGIELKWGNREAVLALVEKIARREGIGDVLANGVYQAAQQIGRGAEEFVSHIKKLELTPMDLRGARGALAHATGDKGDHSRYGNTIITGMWPRPKEEREAYLKSGYFPYPKELEEYFAAGPDFSGVTYEGVVRFTLYDEQIYTLADATGLCYFWVLFYPWPPIQNRAVVADLVSAAAGINIDEAEATNVTRRIINLVRAYNVREGIRRKDDTLPAKFFQRPPVPPYQKFDRDLFGKWIDRSYELKGWNKEGIPTRETLTELGLDFVVPDLERKGILTG